MEITRRLFDEQRRPRFGNANPERMPLEFWEWMIRGHFVRPKRERPDDRLLSIGQTLREGVLKSVYGPWRARDLFRIPLNRDEGPIWNFDRMGRTSTRLADGRTIYVAGEHEDYYDPDFYIYNDVVVIGPDDRVEIFGYPRDVFPPTDFHTATLVGDRIILIGCIGYKDDRRPGETPVYALDASTFQISKLETSGQLPGWIYRHEAECRTPGIITVRGGLVFEFGAGGRELSRRNFEEFELDVRSGVWRQSTSLNWRQFIIQQMDGRLFPRDRWLTGKSLRPYGIEHTVVPSKESRDTVIIVEEVPIAILIGPVDIQIIVQGHLREGIARRVAEVVCCMAEEKLGRRCILEEQNREPSQAGARRQDEEQPL